jgi:single-strand DNA-binding protein
MNNVKLIGNIGKEVTVKNFDNNKLITFSLATSESYQNKNSEHVNNTTWHNIVIWGKLADQYEEMLAKGKFIMVEGKLHNRNYLNKENQKVFITEIVASKIEEAQKKNN